MVLFPEACLLLVQTMGGGTLPVAPTLPLPAPQLLPNITTLFIPLTTVPRGRREPHLAALH